MLADGETTPVEVNGSGEGWSVRYSPLPSQKQMRKWRFMQAVSFSLLPAAGILYFRYLQRTFGISANERSWRATLTSMPFLAFLVAVIWGWDRATKKILRRSRPPDQTGD